MSDEVKSAVISSPEPPKASEPAKEAKEEKEDKKEESVAETIERLEKQDAVQPQVFDKVFMISRDVDGKEIVQVNKFELPKEKYWVYRDSLNEMGKWQVDQFEATVNIKLHPHDLPSGALVEDEMLPARWKPKIIKGVDIVDPDQREPADAVWMLMSLVQMLEEYRDRKDYFAISVGELEEANLRWQDVDMENEGKRVLKRKFEPWRPLTTGQSNLIKTLARNYVPACDRKQVRGRTYDKAPIQAKGLQFTETQASSSHRWIKEEDEEEDYDQDFDEDYDDYDGEQSEAEERAPKFKRAKKLVGARVDSSHF